MKVLIDGVQWRVWFVHRPELQHGHGDQNMTTVAYLSKANFVDGSSLPILGGATCSPRDTYSRARGRKVALARAMKNAGFKKEQRAQVWQGLFGAGMKY